MRVVALLAALLIGAPALAAPHRVASINLCGDELLLALADPGDIASLSPMARDPNVSMIADRAAGFPDNRGAAEEIVREGADLVLTGPFAAPATIGLLQRLNVPMVEVPIVEKLGEIPGIVRSVAAALGRESRGEAMIASMEAALAAIPVPAHRPTALLYEPNGWSLGPGTLSDEVLSAAGFDNQAKTLGLRGYGTLALERVVRDPPDVLITEHYDSGEASMAEDWLSHPALRHLPGRSVDIGSRGLICGTPGIVAMVQHLARLTEPGFADAR